MVLGGLLWVLWGNYGTKWRSSAVSVSLPAATVLYFFTVFLSALPL